MGCVAFMIFVTTLGSQDFFFTNLLGITLYFPPHVLCVTLFQWLIEMQTNNLTL